MRIGGRERGKPDQEEDRGWVYRNCGGERISVCGAFQKLKVSLNFWRYNAIITLILQIERGEPMRADKKGQNEAWLHAKPVKGDICME